MSGFETTVSSFDQAPIASPPVGFLDVAIALSRMMAADVTLTINANDKIAYQAPTGYMTPQRLAFIATNRAQIIAILKMIEPMPPGVYCPNCRGNRFLDDANGLRCFNCQHLAFINTPTGIQRSDHTD